MQEKGPDNTVLRKREEEALDREKLLDKDLRTLEESKEGCFPTRQKHKHR